jgi:hypothetical protein
VRGAGLGPELKRGAFGKMDVRELPLRERVPLPPRRLAQFFLVRTRMDGWRLALLAAIGWKPVQHRNGLTGVEGISLIAKFTVAAENDVPGLL